MDWFEEVSPGIKVKEVDLTRGGITGVSDQTGGHRWSLCTRTSRRTYPCRERKRLS